MSGSLRISVEQLFFKPGSQLKLRDSSIGQKESTPKNLEPVLESEEDESLEDVPEVTLDFEVNLNNAGLVITWPYLLQYFEILGMVKDNKFKTKKMAKRGVQLLQYMATGLTSAPEHELLLNKVLCGVKLATPIPFELDVTDNERGGDQSNAERIAAELAEAEEYVHRRLERGVFGTRWASGRNG